LDLSQWILEELINELINVENLPVGFIGDLTFSIFYFPFEYFDMVLEFIVKSHWNVEFGRLVDEERVFRGVDFRGSDYWFPVEVEEVKILGFPRHDCLDFQLQVIDCG
jgi:hypothetical protein